MYMWKKKQAIQMFMSIYFYLLTCVALLVKTICSSFANSVTYSFHFVCVYTYSRTVAAAASLIFATCNSEL